jgi:hypothetical protein
LGPNPYWEIQARNSGTAATRQLGFYTDSISDDVLTLTQSGNVGIGLTSPSTILHINSGAAADTNVRLQAGAAGNHAKHTYSDSSNTVKWTAGYQSSSGNFGINEGDSFNATGITITSAGNVGIGTSSPVSGKLQVNHSNTESGIYVLEDNAGIAVSGLANFGGVISAPAIRFETSSTERFLVKTAEVVVNDPSNDVDFRVEGDTDTHLIFADAGNDRVGISTSSPSKLFHVAGTAHLPKLNGSTGVAAAENVAKTITYTISVYQTGVMHVMYASATGTAWGSGRQLYTSVYFGKSGGNAGVVTLNAGDTTDANAGDLSVTASGGDIVIAKTAGSGGNNGTLNIMIVSNDDIGQPVIT